jgi:RND family efflux transporter MFP subunit
MIIPKKILLISFLIIAVGLLAYFLVLKKGPASGTPADKAAAASAGTGGGSASGRPAQDRTEAAPLPVKAVPARRGDLIIKLKSPGEAYTDKKIALKAEVSGVVNILKAAEGRHVKEGDVLLELDDLEYRLRLERADSLRLKAVSDLFLEKQFATADKEITPAALEKLNKSEADFKQASAAFQKGLLSQADFEKAQKDYELALIEAGRKRDEIMASSKNLTQLEIDVKIARMELEKCRIRAPFAGIITELKISPREHIDAGRELFSLVNISLIRVKAKVLESEIGKMSVGREVDLRFSAYPGKVFKGAVEAISPIVNADDKTCAVHIAMNNPSEEIKPGMHAEVEIAAEIHKGKLLVPQESILVRGGRKLLFVVEGDLAKWRYVQIGLENEEYAEILPGERPEETVKEGEMVITEGHFTLAHDTRVTVSK